MNIARFAFPTTIHFGAGARTLVAEHLRVQSVERPLIVTDRGIAPLPLLAKFVDGMKDLDVAVYSEIWGNPVKSQVEKGVAAYRAHRADAVIGLGGGAALDVAKAIALIDRKSTRLNSSHEWISYAVFCLKKKIQQRRRDLL